MDCLKLFLNLAVSLVELLLKLHDALIFEVVVDGQLPLKFLVSFFEHLHEVERLLLLHCHLFL